jgi:hypothetical protein
MSSTRQTSSPQLARTTEELVNYRYGAGSLYFTSPQQRGCHASKRAAKLTGRVPKGKEGGTAHWPVGFGV